MIFLPNKMRIANKFLVPKESENQRIDQFCLKILPLIKRSDFFKYLRLGKVLLNKTKPQVNTRLKTKDEIAFLFDINPYLQTNNDYLSLDLVKDKLKIIFEDENIIVVDKPTGIVCQPDKKHSIINLSNMLLKHCGYRQFDSNKLNFYPQFAHRIDRNTSGIVIGAKTNKALKELNKVFKNNHLTKRYKGLVFGQFNHLGLQTAYWKKDNNNGIVTVKWKPFPEAKKISTFFENSSYIAQKDMSLITIRLISGRTHQIRACLNLFSNQLVGDKKYSLIQFKNRNNKYKHQALHAYELVFSKLETSKFPILTNYSLMQFKSKIVPWFEYLIQ
ncbi:RluA family pseudouridine synthase [Mycoplasmoides genitalium M2321]|nr:RluA family pseudouridine synthase [Mycoplasmoides genitalium M2321]